jgi:hypothetical protein
MRMSVCMFTSMDEEGNQLGSQVTVKLDIGFSIRYGQHSDVFTNQDERTGEEMTHRTYAAKVGFSMRPEIIRSSLSRR